MTRRDVVTAAFALAAMAVAVVGTLRLCAWRAELAEAADRARAEDGR